MRKLQICHMIPGFFPIAKGGAEIFARNLCQSLRARGHNVYLITRNLRLPKKERRQGIVIYRFKNILPYKLKYYGFGSFTKSKYLRIMVAIFDVWGALRTLIQLQKNHQFQIIHASFILPFGLVGLFVKKIFQIPLVITVHGPADFYEVPRLFNPVLRGVLKHASAIVAVSEKLKEDLTKRLKIGNIKVIRNGIPLKLFREAGRTLELPKYQTKETDFVILTAGRFVKRKNLDLLIRAFSIFTKKNKNCKLILLGSGVERDKMIKLIKILNKEAYVVTPGWVSEEEKARLFKRADVFIQLSEIEGLSLALLESKAAGTPAIVFGGKNTFNPVSHRKTGLVVQPPLTIEKVIENLELLYQNKELFNKIRRNINDEGINYSLEEMSNKYNQLYFELL
ncbi:MAG: glycosyltransferase [Candidatus Helarchaeota archaeon]